MTRKGSSSKSPKRSGNGLSKVLIPGSGKASTPGQIRVKMVLSTTPTLISSNGSGAVATVYSPSLNSVPNTASFKTTYDEFRVTGVRFHVQAVGASAGTTAFYVDDSDASNPTATSTFSRRPICLPNSIYNSNSSRSFNYRAEDVVDLQFLPTATGSAYTPCALKIYSDAATMNTPISAGLYLVWSDLLVEFRGIGAQ